MKRLLHESRLQQLIRNRNGYLMLASGSFLLNGLLIIFIFSVYSHERVIFLPPHLSKTFWVDGHHVSANYLSEMGLFFTNLRLNVTEESAPFQHETLLRYVHPSFYTALKSQLIEEKERIKTAHLTMIFFPVNIRVDVKHWVVKITGDLQTMMGEDREPLKRVSYQLAFHYDDGRLLVKNFQEVKAHA